MKILLIGSGGREHALAWKIAQSPRLEQLYIAPGNAGTEEAGINVALDIEDHQAIVDFAKNNGVEFVVIGPDAQVVAGLGDDVRAAGIKCFGPSKAAAQLEGSKTFTKVLCDEMNIPTAAYERFETLEPALAHVSDQGAPIVIKADGLAAGKGVVVAMTVAEAEAAVENCFDGAFGAAGASVVIEEFMEGEEVSLFVLCDGENTLLLETAQDHKRAYEGDKGPNTGGMGAYSPAPVMTDALIEQAMTKIVRPTVLGLAQRGTPYRGVLYVGLMLTKDGPKLVEYNARFGDPETQVLMVRLQSDLVDLLEATAAGSLAEMQCASLQHAAMTVILATKGYPGSYGKGSVISGAENLDSDMVKIFHAGTVRKDGQLLANGGRVLNVTALGATIAEAQERAYAAVDAIDWPEGFCRRDIGWRALQ